MPLNFLKTSDPTLKDDGFFLRFKQQSLSFFTKDWDGNKTKTPLISQ